MKVKIDCIECDICGSTLSRGYIYPQKKLGYKFRHLVVHWWADRDFEDEITDMHFCKDCWDDMVRTIYKTRKERKEDEEV